MSALTFLSLDVECVSVFRAFLRSWRFPEGPVWRDAAMVWRGKVRAAGICRAVPVAVHGGRGPLGPGHVAAPTLCSLGRVAVLEGRVSELGECWGPAPVGPG